MSKGFLVLGLLLVAALVGAEAARWLAPGNWWDRYRGSITRIVVGIVLIVAGCLKGYQLTGGGLLRSGDTGWLNILHVQAEIGLGLWILAGVYTRTSWLLATICFAAYTIYATLKLIRGEMSCGCLGGIKAPTWVMVLADTILLTILVGQRRSLGRVAKQNKSPQTVLILCAVGSMLVGILLIGGAKAFENRLTSEFGQSPGAKVMLIKPEAWIGKHCPLLAFLDKGEMLEQGEWTLLIYYRDCQKCRLVLQDYMRRIEAGLDSRLCLVEMPPYLHSATERPYPPNVNAARLDTSREWFVVAPAELTVVNGVVVSGHSGM